MLSTEQPFPLSCLCRSPYGPDLHVMRWCTKCKKWFHKDCLRISNSNKSTHTCFEFDKPNTDTGGRPPYSEPAKKDWKEFLNKLQFLAHSQIAKGQEHGVVGNFHYVSQARNLLQQVISRGEFFKGPNNWMEHLGLTENMELLNEPWRICLMCGNLI
jgi:hypothetical protein